MAKKISIEAYQALRNTLPAVVWFKNSFEKTLRAALRDQPELLAVLDFSAPKRATADALVDQLIDHEVRYQDLTLELMAELSCLERFPDIEQIKDGEDRKKWLDNAKREVANLGRITAGYRAELAAMEARREALARDADSQASQRAFAQTLEDLRQRFSDMTKEANAQKRGFAFESFLNDLFNLYDLEPHLSYVINHDQIDGTFTYDTDGYIVEARWRAKSSGRGDADVLKTKVERRGKNALGLFVSVNGFTADFIECYNTSTSFMTMDGGDLMAVLEGRVGLDDLFRAKKRHANDTGSCYLPVASLLNS